MGRILRNPREDADGDRAGACVVPAGDPGDRYVPLLRAIRSSDANAKKYRPPEEIERYQTLHDPMRLWKQRLIEEGILDEATAERIDHEAREEADAAARFADESPLPSEKEIFSDIYWEVDNNTESRAAGAAFF